MGKTNIEWVDYTANLWWGCNEVHKGCDNCYARVWAARFGVKWGGDYRKMVKSTFPLLDKIQRKAEKEDVCKTVFVGSMMDIFESPMPLSNKQEGFENTKDLRDLLFNRIKHGWYNNIIFLFLTKRPSNIHKYIPLEWKESGVPWNVMFGASVVDIDSAKTVFRAFCKLPREYNLFLSVEPLLEGLDIRLFIDMVDWVIVGGESGGNKRHFNPDWARMIRDHLKGTSVAFFMKQIDKKIQIPSDLMIRQLPNLIKKNNGK